MAESNPPGEMSIAVEHISVQSLGGEVPITVFHPERPGRYPAIAFGIEATGLNEFLIETARHLAQRGVVTALPDYYRGGGPADPENYDDLDDILAHLEALDFTRATRDVSAAVDLLAGRPDVDPGRIGLWGYCTGATLALLTACTRSDIAASVLFYPSQPHFEQLDDAHPASPFDLLWALRCPTLVLYGDQDVVLPPPVQAELRHRVSTWDVPIRLEILPGAGHAFCSPGGSYHHPEAAKRASALATEFIERHVLVH